MKVSVIGSGHLGQATGKGLVKKGNEVLFYDIDHEKLKILEKGGYATTGEVSSAVVSSSILFICVPTPTVGGLMDLSFLEKATTDVAKSLIDSEEYRIVVVRSTVLPSTTRCRIAPLLEKHSKLRAGRDFGLCVNPEFLRQEHALQDFLNPSRIVIGEVNKRSGDLLDRLYEPFNSPIFRTDLDHAEMVKYVANVFLASKISFFNEIFMICKKLSIEPEIVSRIVALDPRIGEYGTHGGRPFAGTCLPKDLKAFIGFVKQKGLNPRLLDEVLRINEAILSYCSDDS